MAGSEAQVKFVLIVAELSDELDDLWVLSKSFGILINVDATVLVGIHEIKDLIEHLIDIGVSSLDFFVSALSSVGLHAQKGSNLQAELVLSERAAAIAIESVEGGYFEHPNRN